ncbi:hypothetical protein [Buchnera aphidicola]|uniref:hypothetical protein n=1 Tax=Buchnera aphidicola TaxID=9 RepID=UPI0031B88FD7
MSSISIIDNIQLLNVNNKIQYKKNNNKISKISINNPNNLLGKPSNIRTTVNLTSGNNNIKTEYIIAPIDVLLNDKNDVIHKKSLNQNNLTTNKTENDSVNVKTRKLNTLLTPTIIEIEQKPDINAINQLMNFGEESFNNSLNFTKNMINKYVYHLSKIAVKSAINEQLDKTINNKNNLKDNNNVLPSDKNDISNIKKDVSLNNITNKNIVPDRYLYPPRYRNTFFKSEKELNNIVWEPLHKSQALETENNFVKQFQNKYYDLNNTNKLGKNFIHTGEHSLITINGHKLSQFSPLTIFHEFKKIIPNLQSRQLISSYITPTIFSKFYYDLYNKYPSMYRYMQKNPVISYEIQELNNGKFYITATHIANLELNNKDFPVQNPHNVVGMKVHLLISKDQDPKVAYLSFLK